MEDGREKLKEKMTCKNKRHGERGMEILARCDKLWKKKREEARWAADGDEEQQQQDEDQGHGDEYKDDKKGEIMKHRTQQYNENPRMMMDGEDIQMVMDCDHCRPGVTGSTTQ